METTPEVNAVGFTSQITAAFRAVELAHHSTPQQPIISDPLAPHLCSETALATALSDFQQLVALQGVGKSLRVPARNRLIDDLLLKALQQLAADGGDGSGKHTAVQVVNIGCGMASQPWRLQKPVQLAVLSWYDVDQPAVMQHKQQLLQQAGAALGPPTATPATQQPAANTAVSQAQFPLLVDRWQPVAADLSQTSLASCLEAHGFDRQRPTVWLAEALLYYLPLDKAFQLLADMRALSAPGSKLIATCIDRELHIADHQRLDKDHYFHAMWHFSIDQLLDQQQQQQQQQQVQLQSGGSVDGGGGSDSGGSGQEEKGRRLQAAGWKVDMQPRTTAALALERYGRETYVPVYGGAECVFTAALC